LPEPAGKQGMEALLEQIRCPESHSDLTLAPQELVERINAEIAAGRCRKMSGALVEEALEVAVLRAEGDRIYPVRQGIPILLVDEAISVDSDSA